MNVSLRVTNQNTAVLQQEMHWLNRLIRFRLAQHFRREYEEADEQSGKFVKRLRLEEFVPPEADSDIPLHRHYRSQTGYEPADRILVAMALAIHIYPQVYSVIISERNKDESGIPQAGGISSAQYAGFIPTGLTWLWLVGSKSADEYARQLNRLFKSHPVLESGIVTIGEWNNAEPSGSGPLILDRKFLMEVLG